MKTLIAIPCFEHMDTAFVKSLVHMDLVGECEISFLSGTLIYDSRNIIAENALKAGFDYIMWLDSDMIFEPDIMKRMFESLGDKDLITGLYFTRRPGNIRPVIFKTCEANVVDGEIHPKAEQYFDYPRNSIFEIEACGFGCVLHKTSMLQDIVDHMGLPFSPAFGFGEDMSFCLRAKQLGYKMYCDSSIKLEHVMKTVSNEDLYLLSSAVKRD